LADTREIDIGQFTAEMMADDRDHARYPNRWAVSRSALLAQGRDSQFWMLRLAACSV
jgi:hypothetical protein